MPFSFDKSYWSAGPRDEPGYCSQQTLFDDLGKELLDHGFAGFNTSIMACACFPFFVTLRLVRDSGRVVGMRFADSCCMCGADGQTGAST